MSYRAFDCKDYSELAHFLMNGIMLYDQKNTDELIFSKSIWMYMLIEIWEKVVAVKDIDLSKEIFEFLYDEWKK